MDESSNSSFAPPQNSNVKEVLTCVDGCGAAGYWALEDKCNFETSHNANRKVYNCVARTWDDPLGGQLKCVAAFGLQKICEHGV